MISENNTASSCSKPCALSEEVCALSCASQLSAHIISTATQALELLEYKGGETAERETTVTERKRGNNHPHEVRSGGFIMTRQRLHKLARGTTPLFRTSSYTQQGGSVSKTLPFRSCCCTTAKVYRGTREGERHAGLTWLHLGFLLLMALFSTTHTTHCSSQSLPRIIRNLSVSQKTQKHPSGGETQDQLDRSVPTQTRSTRPLGL